MLPASCTAFGPHGAVQAVTGEWPQLMPQCSLHRAARCANAPVSEEGQTWSIFGGESSEQVTRPLAVTPRAVTLGTRQLVATWCSLRGKSLWDANAQVPFYGRWGEAGSPRTLNLPVRCLLPPNARWLGRLCSLSIPNCTHSPSKSTYCCPRCPGDQGRGR